MSRHLCLRAAVLSTLMLAVHASSSSTGGASWTSSPTSALDSGGGSSTGAAALAELNSFMDFLNQYKGAWAALIVPGTLLVLGFLLYISKQRLRDWVTTCTCCASEVALVTRVEDDVKEAQATVADYKAEAQALKGKAQTLRDVVFDKERAYQDEAQQLPQQLELTAADSSWGRAYARLRSAPNTPKTPSSDPQSRPSSRLDVPGRPGMQARASRGLASPTVAQRGVMDASASLDVSGGAAAPSLDVTVTVPAEHWEESVSIPGPAGPLSPGQPAALPPQPAVLPQTSAGPPAPPPTAWWLQPQVQAGFQPPQSPPSPWPYNTGFGTAPGALAASPPPWSYAPYGTYGGSPYGLPDPRDDRVRQLSQTVDIMSMMLRTQQENMALTQRLLSSNPAVVHALLGSTDFTGALPTAQPWQEQRGMSQPQLPAVLVSPAAPAPQAPGTAPATAQQFFPATPMAATGHMSLPSSPVALAAAPTQTPLVASAAVTLPMAPSLSSTAPPPPSAASLSSPPSSTVASPASATAVQAAASSLPLSATAAAAQMSPPSPPSSSSLSPASSPAVARPDSMYSSERAAVPVPVPVPAPALRPTSNPQTSPVVDDVSTDDAEVPTWHDDPVV